LEPNEFWHCNYAAYRFRQYGCTEYTVGKQHVGYACHLDCGPCGYIKSEAFSRMCSVYSLIYRLAWLRSVYTGDLFLAEVAPLTGPMYQLFVLFMITDPKTTVSTKKGRMIVAFLIAAVEMAFRLGEAVYAPFYALFIVGPIALIAEKLWTEWKMNNSITDKESGLADAQ